MSDNTSKLWQHLSSSLFGAVDEEFIAKFRRPGGANNRLAAWDPFDKTARYFKFLLFDACLRQPSSFFDLYKKLGDVSIGDPMFVRAGGCDVNIDYFFSVDEFAFVVESDERIASNIGSVVEIGAGFGRTCHAFLKLLPNLRQYTIVDLPAMLALSSGVLQRVASDEFHKVRFISAFDEAAWRGIGAGLFININSFQEMSEETIAAYYSGIVTNCRYAYIKNPIGKYRPESVGLTVQDPSAFHDVFKLGRCRAVLDIFDEDSLKAARTHYIDAYRPEGGALIADKPLDLFPYYHHALYRKS